VPDANNVTVDAVTGQTSGDTISLFVDQTVAVDYLNADTGNDYMSSYVEKAIRSAEDTATLESGEYLSFKYNEVIPIIVRRRENVSIANIKSTLGYTNGVVEGQPVTDVTIDSRASARDLANGYLQKYANAVITATFTTNVWGLESGQYITITDTSSSNRNINQSFVIQKVKMREVSNGEIKFDVTCSSLIYGMVELIQQLLRQDRKLNIDENATVDNVEDANDTIYITESVTSEVDGNKQSETIYVSDSQTENVYTPPFKYGPDPNEAIYNLSSYG